MVLLPEEKVITSSSTAETVPGTVFSGGGVSDYRHGHGAFDGQHHHGPRPFHRRVVAAAADRRDTGRCGFGRLVACEGRAVTVEPMLHLDTALSLLHAPQPPQCAQEDLHAGSRPRRRLPPPPLAG